VAQRIAPGGGTARLHATLGPAQNGRRIPLPQRLGNSLVVPPLTPALGATQSVFR